MSDKRCKCTMAISMTGDGCRYCQPQEYIDRLEEWLDEERYQVEQLQGRCKARDLRLQAEAINQSINNYFNIDNGPHGLKEHLEWQAQRLRERAGEAEQSK